MPESNPEVNNRKSDRDLSSFPALLYPVGEGLREL
jgi:hypothetical protein